MQDYQQAFIDYALSLSVLRFGKFTLKSGRISPYFFNAGLFNTGDALRQIGKFYAAAIKEHKIDFDILFGPAYKGIPLVSTTAIALAEEYQINKGYAFNRKEVKDHGEGGQIVGTTLGGKVLIVDDVITAGTAIRESIAMIKNHDATPIGILVALDRQERGYQDLSAIQEVEKEFNIPVISIIKMQHLIEYLKKKSEHQDSLKLMQEYREMYGV